jgi:hypothetical protein
MSGLAIPLDASRAPLPAALIRTAVIILLASIALFLFFPAANLVTLYFHAQDFPALVLGSLALAALAIAKPAIGWLRVPRSTWPWTC